MPMRAKISFVTLGVDDIGRSLDFYRKWMGLADDQIRRGDDQAAITLEDGSSLVLYPRTEIAKLAGEQADRRSAAEAVLSFEAASREDAEAILRSGAGAGGTISRDFEAEDWGGSGFLLDPDRHLWEIVVFAAE